MLGSVREPIPSPRTSRSALPGWLRIPTWPTTGNGLPSLTSTTPVPAERPTGLLHAADDGCGRVQQETEVCVRAILRACIDRTGAGPCVRAQFGWLGSIDIWRALIRCARRGLAQAPALRHAVRAQMRVCNTSKSLHFRHPALHLPCFPVNRRRGSTPLALGPSPAFSVELCPPLIASPLFLWLGKVHARLLRPPVLEREARRRRSLYRAWRGWGTEPSLNHRTGQASLGCPQRMTSHTQDAQNTSTA